jgi:hypothetical protein
VREERVMSDAPGERDVGKDVKLQPRLEVSEHRRPVRAVCEPLSIAANVIAAIGSFIFLIAAPTILFEFVPLPDEYATVVFETLPLTLPDRTIAALGVALLFLVIGIGFQLWQCRKGLSSWWPLVLAFPIAGILLVPDAVARGGSVWGWAMLGVAMAMAFCVHWLFVLTTVELLD